MLTIIDCNLSSKIDISANANAIGVLLMQGDALWHFESNKIMCVHTKTYECELVSKVDAVYGLHFKVATNHERLKWILSHV